jgi:hypothetical protein
MLVMIAVDFPQDIEVQIVHIMLKVSLSLLDVLAVLSYFPADELAVVVMRPDAGVYTSGTARNGTHQTDLVAFLQAVQLIDTNSIDPNEAVRSGIEDLPESVPGVLRN